MIDKYDIIIIIVCCVLSLFLTIYCNRHRLAMPNCFKSKVIDYKEQFKNKSMEDNIKLIKQLENADKELELL